VNNETPESNEIDTDRIEDKYIISKDHFVEVKNTVDSHLPPYFPEPETVYCINRSIYFDSPDLTFLKQHLAGLKNRRKIRIRCYAPNGIPNHIYFMEIKAKNDGESTKTRVQLSNKGFDDVMKNSQITIDEDFFLTNIQLPQDEVEQHAKFINYLLLVNKCKPICDIVYKRYAHQEHEDLRVTLDTNIKVRPLEMIKSSQIKDLQNQDLYDTLMEYGNKYSNAEDFVFEVKHKNKDDLPSWLQEVIDKCDGEEEGFSKYVWAMAKIIESSIHVVSR
jgi:SPX domain protein involved in polyphosphate accumulation